MELHLSENIQSITNFLFIGDELDDLKQSDLVIVLCNDNIEGIVLNIDKLYRENIITKDSKVIISGATGTLNAGKEKECLRVKNALITKYNYSDDLFTLEENATNIYENLLYSKKFIDSFEKYNNILIIGAAFALRRIKLCASRLEYPVSKMQFVGTVDRNGRNIGKDSWWKTETAQKRVYEEIERIGKYLIKGDLDIK